MSSKLDRHDERDHKSNKLIDRRKFMIKFDQSHVFVLKMLANYAILSSIRGLNYVEN